MTTFVCNKGVFHGMLLLEIINLGCFVKHAVLNTKWSKICLLNINYPGMDSVNGIGIAFSNELLRFLLITNRASGNTRANILMCIQYARRALHVHHLISRV